MVMFIEFTATASMCPKHSSETTKILAWNHRGKPTITENHAEPQCQVKDTDLGWLVKREFFNHSNREGRNCKICM
jgi:hypothetical protein